ncbi:tetratricopeptide repeat-containing sensor histidine kinase [Paraflavitalea pollutisoli]|uniref:tetratricopeptide repeat-containing sensor histidine kinase n=1 Tax=Paraflavitalea pollutisoli TaxID=3034143 RepID=UPI0023EB2F65|nr:histidine kinase dimerization/phosphoacceptor domain -containing protein [Paraflavitalea sp. H1-2-19X]
MKIYYHLVIALVLMGYMASAQQGNEKPPSKQKLALLQKLDSTRLDTPRVKTLLALADYHWRHSQERNYDSVLAYCNHSMELSRKLKYPYGIHESANLLGKVYIKQGKNDQARALLLLVSPEQRSRIFILLGEGFLYQPGLKKPALDSAQVYFNKALQNAQATGSVHWKHESLIALAKYYYSSDQLERGKNAFLEIIHDLQQSKELSKEAHIWSEMGKYMPDTDTTFEAQMWAHGTAFKLYQQLKDTANLYSVLEDIAFINMSHSHFDTARAMFLQVIELRKAIGSKNLHVDARILAWLCYSTGQLEEALKWALFAEKNLEELDQAIMAPDLALTGFIYAADGQPEKALSYFQQVKDNIYGDLHAFVARKAAEQYIDLGQPEKALAYIESFEKDYPPQDPYSRESLAAARGDIYVAMNKPALAEQHYLNMIRLDKESQQYKAREMFSMPFGISGAEAYTRIARFYVDQKRFAEAAPYIATAGRRDAFSGYRVVSARLRRDQYWVRYQVDSAAGNFQSALGHYRQYNLLNDSLTDVVKARQFHQLQVQNETEKKEITIRQRDEQIDGLQKIDRLQRANLQQTKITRNISIVATVVFLLLAVLFYRQYRQKRLANQMVTSQNDQLQHLVREKEWLLREVHHRVKNNLQTIISLLESQAIYLQDDALRAIESSQHRIYAMSLIHQKLYQVENVKTINMSQYLPEFMWYLRESFGENNKIQYNLEVDPISLDLSVAIPVALIVNEAVTNAIKYAFPDGKRGTIDIAMRRVDEEIVLSIADNGVGVGLHLTGQSNNSLGLELMKGLTREIRGHIEILSNEGTTVMVRFSANALYVIAGEVEEEATVSV